MGTVVGGGSRALDAREVLVPAAVAALCALIVGTIWTYLPTGGDLLSSPLTVPGSMAAGLLALASFPAWSISREGPVAALVFSAMLLLVAGAELLGLHHDVEAATGVAWQWFYFPALVATMSSGRRSLRASYDDTAAGWFLRLAGAVWAVGLIFEAVQWVVGQQDVLHSRLATPKDIAEVVGSCMLFVALSIADRSRMALWRD